MTAARNASAAARNSSCAASCSPRASAAPGRPLVSLAVGEGAGRVLGRPGRDRGLASERRVVLHSFADRARALLRPTPDVGGLAGRGGGAAVGLGRVGEAAPGPPHSAPW
jgi:hypothetical protein